MGWGACERALKLHLSRKGLSGKARAKTGIGKSDLPGLQVAMPLIALSDDPSLQDLQSGEQRGRSVAFVVMRHGSAASLFHGLARLRAVQRLDLVLFIHA